VLGLEYFATAPSPSVSAIKVPVGLSSSDIIRRLLENHHIQIASGMGEMAAQIVRISHIGIQAAPEPQLRTLRSLASVLNVLGHVCDARAAENAFQSCYCTSSDHEAG
jgi:aspartate aminotransferase-like enzyme